MGFFGALLGGAGSLISGIMGANAANDAAKAQARAAGQAADYSKQQAGASGDYQKAIATEQRGLFNPYTSVGSGAITNLGQLLQPGGQLTQGFGNFTAPTGVTEQNDPGYQFRLSQGLNALQNSAAARGGLLSSGTAKNINDYAQNQASNEYGNVYNRALGTYSTNRDTFNMNNSNLYNRLAGISGMGLSASGSLGGLLQSGAGNIANINSAAAGQVGQDLTNQGTARASGYIGANNAWQGALGGIVNNLGGYLTDKYGGYPSYGDAGILG